MSQKIKALLKAVGALLVLGVVMVVSGMVLVDHSNPPVTNTQIQWDSAQTEQLVRTACYDCHSNETVWPWYSYVAPVALLVGHDVQEGRARLNFSTGRGNISARRLIEVIQSGQMPPGIYTMMHPAANLTADQRSALIAGIQASHLP